MTTNMAAARYVCAIGVILVVFISLPPQSLCQRITPPPPGDLPVIANGIVYNLNHVPDVCKDPRILDPEQIKFGIVIKSQRRAIMRDKSPYKVHGNIEVDPKSCLFIDPGTVFHFGPGYGILVNGTLIARGSERSYDQRIVMTKDPDNEALVGASEPFPNDARLVDGNTTRDGRLELFYKGKWRGVCTNYINYTKIDANVTCRQLGFVWGNFTYHSFSQNKTEYLLYERPRCYGHENSLFKCEGSPSIEVGTHICDGQQLIGFECAGLRSDLAKDYWRGLEFYNSTTKRINDKQIIRHEPLSWLEYLDISYAGKDVYRGDGMTHGRAAISASPNVPLMNNVTVTNSAYDGLNLTEITGRIHIANSTVSNNRGHGMFIQTSVGRVLINKTDVDENWGDGVKMYMTNYTIHDWDKNFTAELSMCRTPSLNPQPFPVLLHENVIDEYGIAGPVSCAKRLGAPPGKRVTLHFLLMERAPDATAVMSIYDKHYTEKSKIAEFPVTNGSFPQSITSKSDVMYIAFKHTLPPKPTDPKKQRCKIFRPCIRFLLEATAQKGVDEELRFFNSSAINNNGYGVNVQDMRSKVFLNSSVISHNNYGAGLRIYQGAGEVAVNNTVLNRNMRSAINITYSGGYQLVNRSIISENKGYGVITEYMRLNKTRIEHEHKIEIVKSRFTFNDWIAFRIGNYCRGGEILINESYFLYNFDEAVEYLSCNISIKSNPNRNFSLAFNMFNGNYRHGVLMEPFINSIGRMTNNTFMNHSLGAVRIDNGYDFLISKWYAAFDVDYEIFSNTFKENYGRYGISMRLTQNSPFQKLKFLFNKVHDNYINESSIFLNPRNRANAPIVVSSGNIIVQRNSIWNPSSVRDIATHLIDPSVTINASLNWWNSLSHEFMYNKIFDKDDRYNLAEIEYYPALRDKWLYGYLTTHETPKHRWLFARENRIGGILDSLDTAVFTTDPNIKNYIVDKDIFIMPDATLQIRPGTTLAFENSIGMVVHGRLKADGQNAGTPIIFSMYNNPNEVALENRTASVRLMEGDDLYEGRLEVNFNGDWGTVCRDGWTNRDSAVICQQLGLTFNPEFGNSRLTNVGLVNSQKMHLSQVDCNILDTDITKCRALTDGQFSCNPENVVFVRCQPPTWSGVTIPAVPTGGFQDDTQIRHMVIKKAGLLDYEEMMFTPALRIDYNFYKITALSVLDSVSDAVVVKYANPHTQNLFEFCKFDNNLGNGFLTRSPFLDIFYTTMSHNVKGGFVYDPYFTEYEALSVRNFIYKSRVYSLTTTLSKTVGVNSMIFITTTAGQGKEVTAYEMEISASDPRYRITLQLLDYNPLINIEKVTIYDSGRNAIDSRTKKWEIEEDLVDFPIVSTSTHITIKLAVNGVRSGRLAFAAHSRQFSSVPLNSRIYLHNCTMSSNYQGIVTKHYNNPSNEKYEIFHRTKKEEIRIVLAHVTHNKMEAMHIPSLTKYHENYIPTLEEMTKPERIGAISYHIERSKFYNNGKGILGDHNHVDFANNVWHWNFTDNDMRNIEQGGLEIELPRVNDIEERQTHSVSVSESYFVSNKKFAFTVNGYYANVTIKNNQFSRNTCPRGLILLGGMEKDIAFFHNNIIENRAKYAFELNTPSHSEYSENVGGLFSFNNIKNNNPSPGFSPVRSNIPQTYTIALRGVQNITLRRNLIHNDLYQYELVAGIESLSLDTVVDVKENWWGTQFQPQIQERIFDFDDWNSYAIANYFPQLTTNDVNSFPATGSVFVPVLDMEKLGGRISSDLSLPYRSKPYLVVSDLTVMPGVKFIVEPGTTIEFQPNVGILVLGQFVARGLTFQRITLRPVFSTNRVKRATTPPAANEARLRRDSNGTIPSNQGFLELFNSSSKTWNIMCDEQFNEKTAEVVCRERGLETVNVDVRFTHLYDHYIFGKPMYFIKEFWAYSYYCIGDEPNLDSCMKRINYDIQTCIQNANYTFIRCGERNLKPGYEYWGNIRISPPTYEEQIVPFVRLEDKTVLEYIDIYGAGMLHGEKVGAIQATYNTPIISHINMTGCVNNGLDLVAPRHDIKVETMNITGNLGYGINMLILNGESRDIELSSFTPLHTNTMPYHIHGLVEICKMEKEITIENRLIIFYKYSQNALDCVKIITSKDPLRRLSLRFLQLNMFYDDFYRNTLEIFDGKTVTLRSKVVELTFNSSQYDISRRYLSSKDTLSIHMHASPSFGGYGFIAEVVSYPVSGLTYPDSSNNHVLKHFELKHNEDGAILYKNVGEINPSLYIDKCWIEGNGVAILNLTSPPVIDIGIQDTKVFNFEHSFVNKNYGGMYVDAITQSVATHVRGNITNNVFAFTTHGEALNITGHRYQRFRLHENYIFNNTAGDFRDVIHIRNVGVNSTFNVIGKNIGHHTLSISSTSITNAVQEFLGNAFYENNATALYSSVFKINSGKPTIKNNFFVNMESDFEMESYPSTLTARQAVVPIDARQNWWGSDRIGYINGKIWDRLDNKSLVSIVFDPVKITNQSIVEGKCAPGWRINLNRCYRYMGAALPYYEAINFCQENEGFLAEVKDREKFMRYLLRTTENVYKENLRVWIYAEVAAGHCSSFEDDYIIAEQECYRKFLPFVCEKDPYIVPPGNEVLTLAIAISASVFGTALIIVIVLLILWKIKSKRRKDEKFERRESIRGSTRSLNRSRSTMTMLSEAPSKRRLQDIDKYSVSAISSRSEKDLYDSDEKSMIASAVSLNRNGRDTRGNGYAGSRDRLHENGRLGSRDKLNSSDRRLGSRSQMYFDRDRYDSNDRLHDDRRFNSRDRLNDSTFRQPNEPDKKMGSRERLNKSNDRLDRQVLDRQNREHLHRRDNKKKPPQKTSPGSTLEKKLVKPEEMLLQQDTDAGYTDDGFSDNEFDEFTTTADEGGKDAVETDDNSTVMNFHTTPKKLHVENELDSIRLRPSLNDVTYTNSPYNSTPSVDLSGRSKSMSSFHNPESPTSPIGMGSHPGFGDARPPTPPPPLPVDNYPTKNFRNSPLHSQDSLQGMAPVPQPRQRPTPVPRSLQNSKESLGRGGSDNEKPNARVLPQGGGIARNPLHLSRDSLNYLDNRQDWLANEVTEKQDSDEETESESGSSESGSWDEESHPDITDEKKFGRYPEYQTHEPREEESYAPPPYEPPSPYTSHNYPSENYGQRSTSREHLNRSQENIAAYDPRMMGSKGSINLAYDRHSPGSPPAMSNMDYMKDMSYMDASREGLNKAVYENGSYMGHSRENIAGLDHGGSRNNVIGSRQNLNSRSQSRENLTDYHGSMASINSRSRSRENLAGPGVLYLGGNTNRGSPRPEPIETEI